MPGPGSTTTHYPACLLQLPREHGAWAMLYVPFALGALVGAAHGRLLAVLWVAITAGFLCRHWLVRWQRSRRRPPGGSARAGSAEASAVATFALLATLAGSYLVVAHGRYALLFFGAAAALLLGWNVEQTLRRRERTLGGELLAVLGVTMTAPAAHLVARGTLEPLAFVLWGLSALYFASSVYHVKLRVLARNPRLAGEHRRLRRWTLLVHAGIVAALATAITLGLVPATIALAVAPAVVRAVWHACRPGGELRLRRVGIQEIVYALFFLGVAAIAWR